MARRLVLPFRCRGSPLTSYSATVADSWRGVHWDRTSSVLSPRALTERSPLYCPPALRRGHRKSPNPRSPEGHEWPRTSRGRRRGEPPGTVPLPPEVAFIPNVINWAPIDSDAPHQDLAVHFPCDMRLTSGIYGHQNTPTGRTWGRGSCRRPLSPHPPMPPPHRAMLQQPQALQAPRNPIQTGAIYFLSFAARPYPASPKRPDISSRAAPSWCGTDGCTPRATPTRRSP